MKSFVIVVDMQRDFVVLDGALPVPGAPALVAPMQDWLATLRADMVEGVLFTLDTHVPDIYAQSEEAKQFPPHCMHGTPGWALMVDPAALAQDIPCYTLQKGVFDMWAEADRKLVRRDGVAFDRDRFFADLRARGVAVTVVGVAADYCVRWAIDGLVARGLPVTVPADLTRGIDRQIEAVATDDWAEQAVVVVGHLP